MSDNRCPECGAPLDAQAINIEEGVAFCAECGQLSRLSDVVKCRRPRRDMLRRVPHGCSLSRGNGTIELRASSRSATSFLSWLAICAFWNGITSIFVLVTAAGLYTNLVGPLPAWFPAPEMDEPMTLGASVFFAVFMTPFVVIGIGIAAFVLQYAFGRVDVTIGENEGAVATGIGFLVWRRRFDPSAVRDIREEHSLLYSESVPKLLIVLSADRTIRFGTTLPEDRREWLAVVLRVLLLESTPEERQTLQLLQPSDL